MKYNKDIVVKWFAEHGLIAEPEYRFHAIRKWRFDFMFQPDIALEVEGGIWSGGRHTRGTGFKADIEKYNTAVELGWKILRCVPDDLCTMETVLMIKRTMNPPVRNTNA